MTQQGLRFTLCKAGLPQIIVAGILQLGHGFDRTTGHAPPGLGNEIGLQAIVKRTKSVSRECRSAAGIDLPYLPGRRSGRIVENAPRFADTITGYKSGVLQAGNLVGDLAAEPVLDIDLGIIKQSLRRLRHGVQLMHGNPAHANLW